MTSHLSQQLISEWLDGQLDTQDAARVQEHLGQCEDCRVLETEMSAVTRIFREAQPLIPPPFLWTRIAAELQSTSPESHSPAPSWLRPFIGGGGRPVWLEFRALVPAAFLLVLIIGGALAVKEYRSETRIRLAAIAEIDRVHMSLVAGNRSTSNPFHVATETDPGKNPFSMSSLERNPNPFRTLLDNDAAGGRK